MSAYQADALAAVALLPDPRDPIREERLLVRDLTDRVPVEVRTELAAVVAELEDGVHIKALAEYLGHNDPGFTLRFYTHLMRASEDRARQAVDRALTDTGRQAAVDGARAPGVRPLEG